MIEIVFDGTIAADTILNASAEKVEDELTEKISDSLTEQLMVHIDDMDFIDMELNEETAKFEYHAELVLCSKNDIVTNAQIQAQKLSAYGLTPDQIVDVLDTMTNNTQGF